MEQRASLPTSYDAARVERERYEWWERNGLFHEEPDPARPPFIIAMPPPNVTGRAHLGHGSTYTTMDILTRYHRMLGNNADWLPGSDHAAIATESVLVRELAKSGESRESLGRERYLERAWSWAREYGGTIEKQFRTLGFGPDWARSRFTMDEGLSDAVRTAFVRLYREGLIYRGKRLINWDPKSKTTLSDAEIDREEVDATLWFVRYRGADGGDGIVVATTRPETMLGDVAIAVHPDDERYRQFVGANVLMPLTQRAIPVLADSAVEADFGTGAVKVTPAHDATDYDIGVRHSLAMPSILDLDACITDAEIEVGAYKGLDRFVARTRIVADLERMGALVEVRPHRMAIARSERSGEIVEPMLSLQWFVKMESLAKPALQAYRDGRLRFVPERYGRTYEQWLENIRDWNISRQVWWGHQLPVWYTPDGSAIVAQSEREAQEIAQRDFAGVAITRDPDTLDTWFSSGIWPFSILGWPASTPELTHWYPSSVLITGGEIIFLWVARMVMLGLHLLDKLPFPTVFVTPLVFDAQGRKMSKSLGNAIDPMDLVAKFGADAFRVGILRQMRLEGQEIRFQESRCEEARNFNSKIWNALRYALALPEGLPGAMQLPPVAARTPADRWLLARTRETIESTSALFDAFDFGTAVERLWRFIWYELCDWYIEASKMEEAKATRAAVLSYVLNAAMRLLHPIAPFVTEEVWQALPHDGDSIVTAAWPDPNEFPEDARAVAEFEAVQRCVERLRNDRVQYGLPPRSAMKLQVPTNLSPELRALLAHLSVGSVVDVPAVEGDFLAQLDAVLAEAPLALMRERHRREVERLIPEVARSEKKLANEAFVARASAEVVAAERAKLEGYRNDLLRAQEALAAMEAAS
ncbi:MAG TPA: valine--tRNA ligase [Candidatus Dormibacteraeota bacterium]|nr:valine--tRNA ligase [Candidatus Dormibacteraeota bacterium]